LSYEWTSAVGRSNGVECLKPAIFRFNAMFFVKIMGLIGRVALTRWIGAEGVGLFQATYSFYGLLLAIIPGGLPTALALTTARDAGTGWRLFKSVSAILAFLTLIICSCAIRSSNEIAGALGYPNLGFALRCLAPALIMVPILSMARGYLQGLERFRSIAWSEILEQFVRVAVLLVAVPVLLTGTIATAVGGSIVGTSVGAVFAMMFLAVVMRDTRNQVLPASLSDDTRLAPAFKALLKTSMAITVTRLLIPVSDFTDMILIPKRLHAAGYSAAEAIEIYGVMTGMAVVLAYVPTIFTAALSHTVTIRMAEDWQTGRIESFRRRLLAVFKIGWLWGLSSGTFLYIFAPELSMIIFGSTDAILPVRYLAILPLLVGIREISTSLLWAKNHKSPPFTGLMLGIAMNMILIYILAAIPGFGYASISVAVISMELIAVIWNLFHLRIFRSAFARLLTMFQDISVFVLAVFAVFGLHSILDPAGETSVFRWMAWLPGMLMYGIFFGLYFKIRCGRDGGTFTIFD